MVRPHNTCIFVHIKEKNVALHMDPKKRKACLPGIIGSGIPRKVWTKVCKVMV